MVDVTWQTPQQLVQHGFARSPVVMMNEAHDGWARCRRTRQIGREVLEEAFTSGARYLAMECLNSEIATMANSTHVLPATDYGYLKQDDLRELISSALNLGFMLIAYEPDFWDWSEPQDPFERAKRRDNEQALNLAAAWMRSTKMFVWVGNSHLAKVPLETPSGPYPQMACRLWEITNVEPFCIDQTVTVDWKHLTDKNSQRVSPFDYALRSHAGTAGFLRHEAPAAFCNRDYADAFVLSLDNMMTE